MAFRNLLPTKSNCNYAYSSFAIVLGINIMSFAVSYGSTMMICKHYDIQFDLQRWKSAEDGSIDEKVWEAIVKLTAALSTFVMCTGFVAALIDLQRLYNFITVKDTLWRRILKSGFTYSVLALLHIGSGCSTSSFYFCSGGSIFVGTLVRSVAGSKDRTKLTQDIFWKYGGLIAIDVVTAQLGSPRIYFAAITLAITGFNAYGSPWVV